MGFFHILALQLALSFLLLIPHILRRRNCTLQMKEGDAGGDPTGGRWPLIPHPHVQSMDATSILLTGAPHDALSGSWGTRGGRGFTSSPLFLPILVDPNAETSTPSLEEPSCPG